jgi:transcriptional regulator with XRE-family HTH domain
MSNDATGMGSPVNQAINPGDLADANGCPSLLDTAARLKLIRDAFGFSQRELAKRAGVTNSSISMIEQGQVSPSIQSLTRILAAFPVSLADFFGFKLSFAPHANLVGVVGSQSLLDSSLRQLDMRIENLMAGQATAFSAPAVDSCGLVLGGEIQLTLLSGNQLLVKGDSFYIPAGQLFRLINLSDREASLFRCSLFVHKG